MTHFGLSNTIKVIGGLFHNPQKKMQEAGSEPDSCNYHRPAAGGKGACVMARTREAKNPTPPEGSWIRFQLDLRNIKLKEVALKADRSIQMVSEVITGVKNSKAVGAALAWILGFDTYEDLMETARREAKRNAA